MGIRPSKFEWVITNAHADCAPCVGSGDFDHGKRGSSHSLDNRKRLQIAAQLPHRFSVLNSANEEIVSGSCSVVIDEGRPELINPVVYAQAFLDPSAITVRYRSQETPAGQWIAERGLRASICNCYVASTPE